MNRDYALSYYRALGSSCFPRVYPRSGEVFFSVHLRHGYIVDRDLVYLHHLSSEVDSVAINSRSVSDDGMKYLLPLSQLRWLDLEFTSITDRGLAVLSKLRKLEFLDVRGTAVSKNGVTEFGKRVPDCEVAWDDPEEN